MDRRALVSVPVGHAARTRGVTKYVSASCLNHTFDLMVGFSTRPLRIIGVTGAVVAASPGFRTLPIAQKAARNGHTMGYTSLFSAVVILGGCSSLRCPSSASTSAASSSRSKVARSTTWPKSQLAEVGAHADDARRVVTWRAHEEPRDDG